MLIRLSHFEHAHAQWESIGAAAPSSGARAQPCCCREHLDVTYVPSPLLPSSLLVAPQDVEFMESCVKKIIGALPKPYEGEVPTAISSCKSALASAPAMYKVCHIASSGG